MSKNLLVVAFAALSIAAASSAGATTTVFHSEQLSLGREGGSQPSPLARDLRLNENSALRLFDARSAESTDSHIVKAGLWSSVKNAAKKVGSGVKTAAKAVATGAKRAATGVASGVKKVAVPVGKAIWNSPTVKSWRQLVNRIKKAA